MTDETNRDAFDEVEVGDKIIFAFPNGDFEGEETTGGVGQVHEDSLTVKAGAYYQVDRGDFVEIDEKDAF